MVYTAPGPSSGLTRLMSNGYPLRYAKSVDARRFEEDIPAHPEPALKPA